MRRFGIFVGHIKCVHWEDFDHYETRECCGGREVFIAFNRCAEKGVVQSEKNCTTLCSECKDQRVTNEVRAKLNAIEEPGKEVEEPEVPVETVKAAEESEPKPEAPPKKKATKKKKA